METPMKPDADLLEPLGLYQGHLFGRHCTFIGVTDKPEDAHLFGTGESPELAAVAFVENLQAAIKQGKVVILRDKLP